MDNELMALLIEVTSIIATGPEGTRLKKPISVPRPGSKKRTDAAAAQAQSSGNAPATPMKKAIGVLAASARGRRAVTSG